MMSNSEIFYGILSIQRVGKEFEILNAFLLVIFNISTTCGVEEVTDILRFIAAVTQCIAANLLFRRGACGHILIIILISNSFRIISKYLLI